MPLTAFARVVEAGSFAGAAERLGVSVSSVSRARGRARGAPRRAAPQPDDAAALAHRDRTGVFRALRPTARRSRGSRSRRSRRHRSSRAGRCGSRARRRSARAISRLRSPRSPRAIRRCASTSSSPSASSTSSKKDSISRFASARSAARISSARVIGTTQIVCCAAPSYLARHGEPREPEDLAKHVCLTYEYSPTRNVWTFRDADGREQPGANRGSGACEQRAFQRGARRGRRGHRARAGLHHRRPTCAPGGLSRSCASSSRRRSTSTSSIRAAVTCRRRCARSPTSWSSASRSPHGDCRDRRLPQVDALGAIADEIEQPSEHALAIGAKPVVLELVGDPRLHSADRVGSRLRVDARHDTCRRRRSRRPSELHWPRAAPDRRAGASSFPPPAHARPRAAARAIRTRRTSTDRSSPP